jgi:LPS export ABC transporter protein LptC
MKKPRSGLQNNSVGVSLLNIFNYYTLSKGIVVFALAAMLFSCKNDLEEIRSLDFTDTLPELTVNDVEMLYSEYGNVQVKLVSPKLIRRGGNENYIEFPEGFIIYFFDSTMTIKSTISANYGISHEMTKIMEARYNVVVENIEKNEKLNSEELFWDQKKEIIYSNKFVKLTRDEEIITGSSMISDQEFKDVEIKDPKGLIELQDDE